MTVNIYTDGGARGNPGPAGLGLVIYDESQNIIYKNSKYLGIKTNNEAEYAALISSLEWLNNNKDNFSITKFNLFSDSQLLVRQIQGMYKVKASHLKPLHDLCLSLLESINLPYTFTDIRREKNKLADSLANDAMDKAYDS
jgi:ribonuclease HI